MIDSHSLSWCSKKRACGMKLKRTTGIIAVQLWQEIHDHFLNEENKYIPITELQRQWKLIRDSFVRKAKQLKELHTKKSGYSASAVKRILSWPFFERLDFLVVHEDLGIRISNVDNDGYAKVTYLEDRPARPQNPPNFCEVPQPETSRKRKSGDAFEVIHEIAEDLKKQDVRGDEWDAIYYWLNYILYVLQYVGGMCVSKHLLVLLYLRGPTIDRNLEIMDFSEYLHIGAI